MSNKAGVIRYFIERSGGKAVMLDKLAKALNLTPYEVQTAVNNVKRDGKPITIETLAAGQIWRQVDWLDHQPTATDFEPVAQAVAAAGPLPEVVAELEDDEEPPVSHACPYTVVGLSEEEKPIVRDSKGRLFRLLPI
jgi:protoporphyrinogen oxidase